MKKCIKGIIIAGVAITTLKVAQDTVKVTLGINNDTDANTMSEYLFKIAKDPLFIFRPREACEDDYTETKLEDKHEDLHTESRQDRETIEN